jgi:hypothetical protein
MMMTGIMGLYVGRIYAEVKGRPLYVIDRAVGFDADGASVRRPGDAAMRRPKEIIEGGRPERRVGRAREF